MLTAPLKHTHITTIMKYKQHTFMHTSIYLNRSKDKHFHIYTIEICNDCQSVPLIYMSTLLFSEQTHNRHVCCMYCQKHESYINQHVPRYCPDSNTLCKLTSICSIETYILVLQIHVYMDTSPATTVLRPLGHLHFKVGIVCCVPNFQLP